ncbi:MAG: cbb3-type cytochrome oxidase assembly protein CcoS [Proteobacteria bacterium]|nr:MAG: cbb3-type cytochrome oxidase assembly protein CcoS [Pseudomonadota bacterium]
MEILYALIPLSIILLTVAIYVMGWAVKSGQYDDLEGPAHRILYDDDKHMIPTNRPTSEDSAANDKETG